MASRIALSFILLATALLPACDGEDKPKPDSAIPGDGASVCGGMIDYLKACTTTDECGSCVCQSFGHSKVCTKTCTVATDCPAPSGGCSNGFCRP